MIASRKPRARAIATFRGRPRGPDADSTLATWHIDDHVETVQLGVAADGALREISMSRGGNPGGAAHGRHPFGIVVEDQTTFDGIRLRSKVRAFWEWGTDRQTAASSSELTSFP